MKFGKAVRDARTRKRMTLSDLAERVGITKGYLSGIETCSISPPRHEKVKRIARFLGLDYEAMAILAVLDSQSREVRKILIDAIGGEVA